MLAHTAPTHQPQTPFDEEPASLNPTSQVPFPTLYECCLASSIALSSKKSIVNNTTNAHRIDLDGLWDDAYKELSDDPKNSKLVTAYEKCLAQSGNTEKYVSEIDPIPHLRSVIEDRFEEIERSRVKFILAGKEIIIKDQMRRVADKILSVKDVVTTAVSAEPHATLAWAGALVILNSFTNSLKQDEKAIDGFEYITILLTRYGVVQSDWNGLYSAASQSKASDDGRVLETLGLSVRKQMVKMYKAIIQYQISLARHYEHLGLYRFLEDFAVPQDWTEMIQNIKSIDESVSRDLGVMNSSTLVEIDGTLKKLYRNMEESYDMMHEVRNNTQTTKYLQFVNILEPRVAQKARLQSFESQYKAECFEGTQVNVLEQIYAWILSAGPEHMYWLRGMAGTGKSTISRTIATQCLNRKSLPETTCLGGTFFFDQNQGELSTAPYLFPTLCTAIGDCLPDIRSEICEVNKDHSNILYESLNNQWKKLILEPILRLESRNQQNRLPIMTLVVVIDGIDECNSGRDGDTVGTILNLITEASQFNSIRLKFLLTSRPESHIFSSFEDISRYSTCLQMGELQKIEPSTGVDVPDDDITKFLRIKTQAIAKRHPSMRSDWPGEDKFDELRRKADGLWIYAATACLFIGDEKIKYVATVEKRLNDLLREGGDLTTAEGTLDMMYLRILQTSIMQSAVAEEMDEIRSLFQSVVGSIVVLCNPLSVTALAALLTIPNRDDIETLLSELGSVISFLKEHILHWLEVLSILGRMYEGTNAVIMLSDHVASLPTDRSSAIREFVVDLRRFVLNCRSTLEYAPLQLYRSALIFCPEQSLVRRQYQSLIDKWLIGPSISGRSWSPLFLTLEDELESSADAYDVALSPDGNMVASGLSLWDTATGVLLKDLDPMGHACKTAFSLDGKSVMSLSSEGHLRIWDVFSGRLIKEVKSSVEDHRGQYFNLFSPDRAYTVSYTTTLEILDIKQGTLVKAFKPHANQVSYIVFSANSELLATTCGGEIRIWEVATGNMRHDLGIDGSNSSFKCAEFCQKTEVVGAISQDSIFIWSVATGELLKRFPGELRYISSITFSPIRNWLVITGSYANDSIVKIWNWKSGEVLRTIHTYDCSLARFSPDGRLFTFVPKPLGPTIALSPNHPVKVWDAITGQQVAVFNNDMTSMRCAVFSENKKWLVFRQGTVRLWDLARQVEHDQHEESDSIPIDCVYLSPDNKMAVTFGENIRFWDLEAGTLRHRAGYESLRFWDLKTGTLGHRAGYESLRRVFLSPDSKIFVNSTGMKDAVQDLSSGEIIFELGDSSGSCYAFSKDGTILARTIVGAGSQVQIWGVYSQRLLHTVEVPGNCPMFLKATSCLTFSPSGRFLAAATRICPHIPVKSSEDQPECDECVPEWSLDISIWEVKTGELCMTFPVAAWNLESIHKRERPWQGVCEGERTIEKQVMEMNMCHDLTWSPDETLVAALYDQGQDISVWDITQAKLLHAIENPGWGSGALAFSPGSAFLASATRDVQLWDMRTGKLIGERQLQGSRHSLRFSSDGTTISTDTGRVDVRSFFPTQELSSRGNILVDDWIVLGMRRVLYLPHDYRSDHVAVTDNMVIMGHESGRVSFIRLDAM
ncbi:hypothetical protein N7528_009339 [Penicillium herquei]|nr:hypothetical protein N7528_009339 [Penicillium herquei]